jgi:hypothetical protein
MKGLTAKERAYLLWIDGGPHPAPGTTYPTALANRLWDRGLWDGDTTLLEDETYIGAVTPLGRVALMADEAARKRWNVPR